MKLRIDPEVCQGHARCYALAPELFDLDDLGHAETRSPEVPASLEDAARLAVSNCPERAITLE